jgi:ATP-dependent DNA helicase PIF1
VDTLSFQPYLLNQEHHYTLDRLDDLNGCLFLTGRAGTGKSTLIQLFRTISNKRMIFLAPTGVAAVQIKGQTIHSFFKFPPNWFSASDYKPISKKLIEKIELIVIDEISMVRADLLDHIDKLLRLSLRKDVPFGGIPMVWTGDLFQLPPVLRGHEEINYFKRKYESPYFFSAHVFGSIQNFEMIELEEVFRQKEKYFLNLLEKIRMNEMDESDLDDINNRYMTSDKFDEEHLVMTLCATNQSAQWINSEKLKHLAPKEKVYKAKISGHVSNAQYPADEFLILKEGAQVMMLRNDPAKRYVNGSLGKITRLNEESIEIKLDSQDRSIEVEVSDWEIVKYKLTDEKDTQIKTEVVGTFTQFPVRLAWAMTIHKSQGKTFDNVIIDFGRGAFEHGQAYVALSRCKTLDGIYLKQKLRWEDIHTDERVIDFLRLYR